MSSTTRAAAAKPFPNYTELPNVIPPVVWQVLRVATLLATIALVWVIFTLPNFGYMLFWGLAVPLLPAVFAFVPGLWRQVCPMGFLNQMPRTFGFSLDLTLPIEWKNIVYLVSVILFFGLVSLRPVLFNVSASAFAGLIIVALVLAFFGGLVFKGRSGWCGTFCPLAPVQRAYGHAPVVMVKNGYCPTCVGCQKNCYDFNPTATIHSDLSDNDLWYAGHKKFFVGALPGFILGFYLSHNPLVFGAVRYYLDMGMYVALSLGAFMALTGVIRISAYKVCAVFAMGALGIYYWFASPLILQTVSVLGGIYIPTWGHAVFVAEIGVLAAAVLFNGMRLERAFAKLNSGGSAQPRVGVRTAAIKAAGAGAASDLVIEKKSGRSFAADPSRSLLEGIESAGIKIDFGCRMGMCGADPVVISEGLDKCSTASNEELATLRRLGLEGRARMACVCHALKGGVTVDLGQDPHELPEPPQTEPQVDLGELTGIKRVVIIGNGAAGMAAADEIRRSSPTVQIDVVAKEDHPFYNRMAIGRLLYGRSALDGIYLVPPDWADKKKVTLWLNTMATGIDLKKKEVLLGIGETLTYDKLIMAQGSRALIPPAPGTDLPGCFVLREASDAFAIRRWRQERNCKTAVVVGGGVLGIEAADALRHLNLQVTILQRDDRIMNRDLDSRGSEIVTKFLEGMGIHVRTKAQVAKVAGDGRVQGVDLQDGESIPAQVYLAAAGIAANVELAREAGLKIERGILVDRAMRTSDADVLAIGDVAELPGERGGLWSVSNAQAAVAASTIFGQVASYVAPSTLVTLKLEGIDVKGFGLTEPKSDAQEMITDADEPENIHRKIIVENGRVVGAVFVGPPGIGKHIGAVITKNADLTPILDELRKGNWDALAKVT
ncbi:MAG TPA: FAD-dependent oxidoreductase [Magnetospirillaceae bacterium]|jgi:NADPH-dependent 2,4-dienoyl-CoA reductase/sulfur reductase-like enzyme/ferredoxin